eukprot:CAMPEP_0119361170 /NCGR_PEP_ID=MMETSP1334-20130426/8546_1 /TAXON_ID=127549 /ORGANISM="Calcidiscus leptoporus, Strain RCC1130" /LENGTH=127 /DNA_ID=CAMNT_0007376117 /DNA_START=376 /DNA_END=757 /DNA_ORIENTATION=-
MTHSPMHRQGPFHITINGFVDERRAAFLTAGVDGKRRSGRGESLTAGLRGLAPQAHYWPPPSLVCAVDLRARRLWEMPLVCGRCASERGSAPPARCARTASSPSSAPPLQPRICRQARIDIFPPPRA